MTSVQRITPCLWFDRNAEEAVEHYVSIFPRSRVLSLTRYGDTGPGPAGSVMTITFQLDGCELTALNGGPEFKFTEAVSLMVHCEDQAEVDAYWSRLAERGQEVQCGWLKDRFGLSWQIVPRGLFALLQDPDPERRERDMKALLSMTKIDLARLARA